MTYLSSTLADMCTNNQYPTINGADLMRMPITLPEQLFIEATVSAAMDKYETPLKVVAAFAAVVGIGAICLAGKGIINKIFEPKTVQVFASGTDGTMKETTQAVVKLNNGEVLNVQAGSKSMHLDLRSLDVESITLN